ncbi:MAG: hypothetical protein ACM3NQ_01325 [Bacteroidales bacterium]
MATYSITTTPHQEDVAVYEIKRRQAFAASINKPYDGPATTGQLLMDIVTKAYVPMNDNYDTTLRRYYEEELIAAADTDTKAAIMARALARMTA